MTQWRVLWCHVSLNCVYRPIRSQFVPSQHNNRPQSKNPSCNLQVMFSSGNSVCSKAAWKHTTELVTLLSLNVKVCDRASSDLIATFPLLEDVWRPAGRRDRYPLASLCLPLCLRVGLVYALPSGKCFPPDAWTDTAALYPPPYRNVKTKRSDSLCPRSPGPWLGHTEKHMGAAPPRWT